MTTLSNATFASHYPVTGEVITNYPITDRAQVHEAVSRARAASLAWQNLGFKGRRKVLLQWSNLLISKLDEITEIVSRETGKPVSDAKLEAALAVGHLGWAARHAEDVMRTSHRSPGVLMANMSATVERSPVGVVGVIGPWNYPIFTPMGSISYALAAGNTVVFKPSEYTPGVGTVLADTFAEVAPFADIFTCITGLGETGKDLCESGVDKLAFTGSTRTAKLVAASCATTMTPVVLECGGKDPVIVAADADIKRAADATIWSAMSNAGQTCIGAERVYVHESVADKFIEEALKVARSIHPGAPGVGNYGPATMPKFGPTIAINRVKSMEEAIALSNASRYGLGSSIWSKRQGKKIARQLHCGMVAINSTISFAAIASVPFGGVKDSGYGRIHGPEGILEFTYPRTVVRARFQLPIAFTSFKRTKGSDKLIVILTRLLNGRLG